MNYEKPEVQLLGEANKLILSKKPHGGGMDTPANYTNNPAYELDE